MNDESTNHDGEQLKAIIDIFVWQQIQITTLRNMLCEKTLNGNDHLQHYRITARGYWNDYHALIENTIQQLQDPSRIEEVFARLQGFADDFEARQPDDDQLAP